MILYSKIDIWLRALEYVGPMVELNFLIIYLINY